MNIRGEIGSRLLGRRGWVGEVKQTDLRTKLRFEPTVTEREAMGHVPPFSAPLTERLHRSSAPTLVPRFTSEQLNVFRSGKITRHGRELAVLLSPSS
jgi:hypothetical protein